MGLVLAAGVGAFLFLLGVQVVLWRLLHVKREMFGLAVIYLLVPCLLVLAVLTGTRIGVIDVLLAGFLYLALACGYIQTYPALREDIPSFRILFAIEAAGPAGLDEAGVVAALEGDSLFSKKMDDLASDRLIGVDAGGQLYLLPAGLALARVFRAYRKALGLQRGLG